MKDSIITPIATISNDYTAKFGIPRQAGLVPGMESRLVFAPPYRVAEALRGIEEFDYLWLIWQFSANLPGHAGEERDAHGLDAAAGARPAWSPTVRPPRLGGNRRLGVFATRSPFRPNALGLSAVRLLRVEWATPQGPVLHIAGADLMDGTPVFDIKPYLPYADAHAEARGGFAAQPPQPTLAVHCPAEFLTPLAEAQRATLLSLLALDPRPSYQQGGGEREYGFRFADREVRFRVAGKELTVLSVS